MIKIGIDNGLRIHEKTPLPTPSKLADAIVAATVAKFQSLASSRSARERAWLLAWAEYFGTPESYHYLDPNQSKVLQNRVASSFGVSSSGWRNKINIGKGFEITEQHVAAYQQATFPGPEYVAAEPIMTDPTNEVLPDEQALLATKFYQDRLKDSNVEEATEMFFRQAVICGETVMRGGVSTCSHTGRHTPFYETGNMFDFWHYDYRDSYGEEHHDVFKTCVIHKAEIVSRMLSGEWMFDNKIYTYQNLPQHYYERHGIFDVENMLGYYDTSYIDDNFSVLEYWGQLVIHDRYFKHAHIVLAGNIPLKIELGPSAAACPYVFHSFINLGITSYGFSALDPVMGSLRMMNQLNNRRLDALELAVNQQYTLRQSSVLAPSEVNNRPGEVYSVEQHDDLKPILQGNFSNLNLSAGEQQMIGAQVEKTTGTGVMIGGVPRDAERVTAEEISSVRDLGSSRMQTRYRLMEKSLQKVHQKTFAMLADMVDGSDWFRADINGMSYNVVATHDVLAGMNIRLLGSQYLIARQKDKESWLEFMNMFGVALKSLSVLPESAGTLNVGELLKVFGKLHNVDVSKLINAPEAPTPDLTAGLPGVSPAMSEGAINQQMAQPQLSGTERFKQLNPAGSEMFEQALNMSGGQEQFTQQLLQGAMPNG